MSQDNKGTSRAVRTRQLPPSPGGCSGFLYIVKPSDTLLAIAGRFGVSLQAVLAANPQITNPDVIFVGQVICIPRDVQTETERRILILKGTADSPGAAGLAAVQLQPAGAAVVGVGLPEPGMYGIEFCTYNVERHFKFLRIAQLTAN